MMVNCRGMRKPGGLEYIEAVLLLQQIFRLMELKFKFPPTPFPLHTIWPCSHLFEPLPLHHSIRIIVWLGDFYDFAALHL